LNFGFVLDQWERDDQPYRESASALSDIYPPNKKQQQQEQH